MNDLDRPPHLRINADIQVLFYLQKLQKFYHISRPYDDIDDISEDSIAVKQFIYAQESYNTSKDTKDLDTAKTAIARAKTPEIKKSLQQRLDDTKNIFYVLLMYPY